MAVNTWDGAADTDWNTAGNWDTTGVTDRVPTADDDVVIPNVSNDPVMGDGLNPTINSLEIQTGGNFTAGANTITIDGESGTKAMKFHGSGTFTAGTSTFIITTAADSIFDTDPAAGGFNNLTINASSRTFTLEKNLTVGGNLTITAGTLDTTGSNFALTVTGATTIGAGGAAGAAVLTCNASAVSLGS